MRDGRARTARGNLETLIERFPGDTLAEPTTYDVARLALEARDFEAARMRLDRLIAIGRDPALAEPARFLRCRVDAERAGPAAAEPCCAAFRRDFPASPHDAEVLALLASAALARGDCHAGAPLLDEYLRRYPQGPFAEAAKKGSGRCGR